MLDYLRSKGLRITPQRRQLIEILNRIGKFHPSFSEICSEVWKTQPSISQSTILNNLVTFEKIGAITSFSFRGETHYELNPRPHVNMIDTRGRIIDIDDDEIQNILNRLLEQVRKKTSHRASRLLVIIE